MAKAKPHRDGNPSCSERPGFATPSRSPAPSPPRGRARSCQADSPTPACADSAEDSWRWRRFGSEFSQWLSPSLSPEFSGLSEAPLPGCVDRSPRGRDQDPTPGGHRGSWRTRATCRHIAPGAIIIGCDPGPDDALALFLALASPELEPLGITAVGGNVALAQTQANARRLCEVAGRSRCRTLRRKATPSVRFRRPATRSGVSGFFTLTNSINPLSMLILFQCSSNVRPMFSEETAGISKILKCSNSGRGANALKNKEPKFWHGNCLYFNAEPM